MIPFMLGVSGGTGSGKSTVAAVLRDNFGPLCTILPQDAYYRDQTHLPFAERVKANYDHPDAFDNDLFHAHLAALRAGAAIERPVYSFALHTRLPETIHLEPSPIFMVEGILLFHDARLRDLFDLKVYIDTDADIRLIRRVLRDVSERGRTVESVFEQYLATVKPMHEAFVEPSKRYADLILPEGGLNQRGMEAIIARVRAWVAEREG
ncbi:MAG: uridine kinase [Patescibacteria group bacterium]